MLSLIHIYAIEKSLMDEYKAEFDKADNGRVVLDRRTGPQHQDLHQEGFLNEDDWYDNFHHGNS